MIFSPQECADVDSHSSTTNIVISHPQQHQTMEPQATAWLLASVPQGRQCKGGSKSSTSSSSSQRSGGGGGSNNRHGNAAHSSGDRGGGRSNRRSFSGTSDSSDDGKDDDDKRRRPYRRKKKEPKSKPGFSDDDDDDDEATDSADEGRGQDTPPNNMSLDFSPPSLKGADGQRGGGSKDRFRPSNLPSGLSSSKARSSNGSSSSTISVESLKGATNRIEMGAHVPPSPVNMAVGYGVPSSAAPLVLDTTTASQSKSPTESGGKELLLGTPTVDSPRPLALKEANSPGTPPVMSPEIPPTFTGEVIGMM